MAEWDEYPGRFEATDRVDVRARVDGYLDSIHFRDGALVKRGDLLFVMNPRPYEAVLDGARADVIRAQTRVELATTDLVRGGVAVRDSGHQPGRVRPPDPGPQGSRRGADRGPRQPERSAALNVEFTSVRAPIGGRISENFVSVGNLISGGQAGSTVLTTIVAVDPIDFVFDAGDKLARYNRMNADR